MNDRPNLPDTADHVGQAAGGITGVVAGAAIGSTAGPIGTLLGGIAGAIGGWWSGRALAEAAEDITSADKKYCHDCYARDAKGSREDAESAFYLGHVATANPAYAERSFEDVEGELSRGWATGAAGRGEWPAVRDYASIGFSRGRERRRTPR